MSLKSWEKRRCSTNCGDAIVHFPKWDCSCKPTFFAPNVFFRQSKLITLYVVYSTTLLPPPWRPVCMMYDGKEMELRACLKPLFHKKPQFIWNTMCLSLLFKLNQMRPFLFGWWWWSPLKIYVCGLVLKQEIAIPIMMDQLIWFFARG